MVRSIVRWKPCLLLALFAIGCYSPPREVKICRQYASQLEQLLAPAKFEHVAPGTKIELGQRLSKTDPLYQQLLSAGFINGSSAIYFGSSNCVSLRTRKKDNTMGFKDYVLFFNLNEGQFMCNINDLYTLNQDEHVNHLRIFSYPVSAYMVLSIVDNQ